jgi:catechol 2,3-dioxygenase-like lactoylglutathione lyase family enzyme
MALELLAPTEIGTLAIRLKELLAQRGPGLQTLVFASDALEEDRRIFGRRALHPEAIQPGESVDHSSARRRQWTRFRIDDAQSNGVRMFVLQRSSDDPLVVTPTLPNALSSLDHLVVNTVNPERALALYGARLGLRLALDLSMTERDARLLSFKAGTNTIELSHRISKAADAGPDKLWGITWRTPDIIGARERMAKKGLNVSEVRKGMRKGTRVFTVNDGTLNVPTLILSADIADHLD